MDGFGGMEIKTKPSPSLAEVELDNKFDLRMRSRLRAQYAETAGVDTFVQGTVVQGVLCPRR